MTEQEKIDFEIVKTERDLLLISNARLNNRINVLEKIITKEKRVWVGLEAKDMSDDPNPMYDDKMFNAGLAWACNVLMKKNS